MIVEALTDVVSKPTDERGTPRWLIEALDLEFHFAWDLAALSTNVILPALATDGAYFGPDHYRPGFRDGLAIEWHKVLPAASSAWLNPPFSGRQILRWCAKCEQESAAGLTIVALLPADVSTEYWQTYVERGEKRMLRSRLVFEGAPRDKDGRPTGAKFGSVLRIWRPTHRYWSFA